MTTKLSFEAFKNILFFSTVAAMLAVTAYVVSCAPEFSVWWDKYGSAAFIVALFTESVLLNPAYCIYKHSGTDGRPKFWSMARCLPTWLCVNIVIKLVLLPKAHPWYSRLFTLTDWCLGQTEACRILDYLLWVMAVCFSVAVYLL